MKMNYNFLKSNKGQSMVIFALAVTVLMGFAAIVIDIGRVTLEKSKLQNAIDASALAAAQDLPDTSKATAIASQYITSNGYSPSDITITFSDSDTTINITGSKKVEYTLARVIGFESTTVTPKCAAVLSSGEWAGEALPFINMDDDYQTNPEIVAWEKTSPGDFESISNYEVVNEDDPEKIYFKVDYMNGITLKKGVVANKKQEIGYIYEQHKPDKPVYVLSLSRNVINSGQVKLKGGGYRLLDGLKNDDVIDPSQLVLLECIFHDYDYQGKTLFLTVKAVYDIAHNSFPPDYVSPDGGQPRLIK